MFLNVITSSFLVIFTKLSREELLGFSNLGSDNSHDSTTQTDFIHVLVENLDTSYRCCWER